MVAIPLSPQRKEKKVQKLPLKVIFLGGDLLLIGASVGVEGLPGPVSFAGSPAALSLAALRAAFSQQGGPQCCLGRAFW